jgi:hypothetical protein
MIQTYINVAIAMFTAVAPFAACFGVAVWARRGDTDA